MKKIIFFFKRVKTIIRCRDGNFIKTLYYNFKYLSFNEAILLPMIISSNTIIRGKGKIIIDCLDSTKQSRIYIGAKALKWMDLKRYSTYLHIDGELYMSSSTFIGLGSKIEIGKNAKLVLGSNFNITGLAKIICYNSIIFGRDALISWDTLFMDTDSHTIINNDGSKSKDGDICIGDRVWVCSKASILKNSNIANDIVIACNSVTSGSFKTENVIIATEKSKVIKENISWIIDKP